MAKKDLASLVADLKHKKPKKRIQACQALTKLGDPQAIPDLVTVYKKDADEKVKAAAEKALYKFRTMQPVAPTARSTSPFLKRLRILLGVTLVILVIANIAYMVLGGDDDGEEKIADTTLRDRDELLDRVATSLDDAEDGALAIQEETENKNCERNIKRPSVVELSAMEKHTYPDLAEIVASEHYIAIFGFLNLAYDSWKVNCDAGKLDEIGVQISISEMSNNVLDNLAGPRDDLETARTSPAPTRDPELFGVPPTAAPTATYTPAPTPTLTPIAGIDYPTHIAALDSLYNKLNPAATEMQNRWQTVADGGQVGTCIVSSFGLDPLTPYTLEPDQTGDENLDEATRLINETLVLMQANLADYATQCVLEGGLQSVVDERLPEVNTAAENLTEAKIRLDSMRER